MYFSIPVNEKQRGFVLITSLCLMTLLCLLALASIQLSKHESHTIRHQTAQHQARANARLALQIALAQLQHYTGRDTTTTCRSDILLPPDTTGTFHPHFTLAFQSEPISGNFGTGVQLTRPAKLPAILVSGNEAFDLLNLDAYPPQYTQAHSPILRPITLDSTHQVQAPLVSLTKGNYAYWVSDEGVKARINLDDPLLHNKNSLTESFHSQRAPASFGTQLAGNKHTQSYLKNLTEPYKYIDLNSFALLSHKSQQALPTHTIDVTSSSRSLLSNPLHGGLKKNLSAALLKDDEAFLKLTEVCDDPVFLYGKWTFPNGAHLLSYRHYPGAPWALFRSHLRRHESEPWLTGPQPTIFSHLGSAAHQLPFYWDHSDTSYIHPLTARLVRRSPVLLRFQLGIDYTASFLTQHFDSTTDQHWQEFSINQHFIPYAAFWNPYDATLISSEAIDFKLFLDRTWYGGSHDSILQLHFPKHCHWQVQYPHSEEWHHHQGPQTLRYPYHPNPQSAPRSERIRSNYQTPPFTLPAGQTLSFQAPSQTKPLSLTSPNRLSRCHSSPTLSHSFVSSNLKIRVACPPSTSAKDLLPEITLLRYPAEGGQQHTRLHVTNATSFQRIHWNLASFTSQSKLHFVPKLLNTNDPHPPVYPKFSALLLRKMPHIAHYFPSSTSWGNTPNTNAYLAPWQLFYQLNPSRHGALGAPLHQSDSFISPPQYLSGLILGSSAFHSPETTPDGRCFVGYSDRYAHGTTQSITTPLPREELRLFSPAHFSHINLSKWLSNYNADQSNASATDTTIASNAIGNSFASPHLPLNATQIEIYDQHAFPSDRTATHYDASFKYNHILWDRYFLTGQSNSDQSLSDSIGEKGAARHLVATPSLTKPTLDDPHRAAAHLWLHGGFNVNSTSTEAWKIILASSHKRFDATSKLVSFPRLPYGQSHPITTPPSDPSSAHHYAGTHHRALTPQEVTQLAEAIVAQNQKRGPSSSLGQWINRSLHPSHHHTASTLTTDDVCYEGTLQAAINATKLNGVFHHSNAQFPKHIVAQENDHTAFQKGWINPRCLKYHSAYGAPATLTQADVLNRIGHLLTSRSDTFKIRAYGDCTDARGRILAKAFCEAIVQRFPEYCGNTPAHLPPKIWQPIDPSNPNTPYHWIPNPKLDPQSTRYGRRYKLIAFRWLNPSEI
ncbi:hypothetical protein ACFSW8_16515 [Rubritalea tangerina]|uniref:Flp pilus-assembly TadG-like N-terminal domain-containing protein n=2 Tax=Rubritalea tangerina TaxID=430798 RepID=A0ABW4ZFQ2_9BACT